MRRPLIAGNWKMYKTTEEAVSLATGIKEELCDFNEVDIVLCPPFTALYKVNEVIKDTNIKLGAQNLFWEDEGAYTGEVSAKMIKDCGCQFVIIGHSERRKYFFESDEWVNRKILSALNNDLVPIVCIGETLEEREKNLTIDVIEKQLKGAFYKLGYEEMKKIVIAYEPVWAIGTGKTALPYQAEEIQNFIRRWLKDNFSLDCADNLRILYGGSVKPSNIKELMREEDIDGALVGGASLEVDSFTSIVRNSIIN
ncbi:MAG: triose-phosphate isomerase [Candidatus Omnitrophica bacterium]|nr:triose-phosphate isomerase [Candidatus Omnitrophota bacterium]MCM8825896.1 triose-phosphate isomerase [Candidatus Omnitrophota bacterium]